jgi:hypothetical protein
VKEGEKRKWRSERAEQLPLAPPSLNRHAACSRGVPSPSYTLTTYLQPLSAPHSLDLHLIKPASSLDNQTTGGVLSGGRRLPCFWEGSGSGPDGGNLCLQAENGYEVLRFSQHARLTNRLPARPTRHSLQARVALFRSFFAHFASIETTVTAHASDSSATARLCVSTCSCIVIGSI